MYDDDDVTQYPYIIYGKEWINDAISFFNDHSSCYGNIVDKFKANNNYNEYYATIDCYNVPIREDFSSDVVQIMRLKPIVKKNKLEADEIVVVFTKFDDISHLNELYYLYADGTTLKVFCKLLIERRSKVLIVTDTSYTTFIQCTHDNPIAVIGEYRI